MRFSQKVLNFRHKKSQLEAILASCTLKIWALIANYRQLKVRRLQQVHWTMHDLHDYNYKQINNYNFHFPWLLCLCSLKSGCKLTNVIC